MTLISISPDAVEEWSAIARTTGVQTPTLSDPGNRAAEQYGVMRWRVGNEPGHTFIVVDAEAMVRSVRDYGAPANGGLMYVPVEEIIEFLRVDLGREAG